MHIHLLKFIMFCTCCCCALYVLNDCFFGRSDMLIFVDYQTRHHCITEYIMWSKDYKAFSTDGTQCMVSVLHLRQQVCHFLELPLNNPSFSYLNWLVFWPKTDWKQYYNYVLFISLNVIAFICLYLI